MIVVPAQDAFPPCLNADSPAIHKCYDAPSPWVTIGSPIPDINQMWTINPEHLDAPGGFTFVCDKGVSDLTFTKSEKLNEWHLYVTCNGTKRSYKITVK